ncbi:glycoside hydrolase family 57 [bacterium]|nr:glycoside hydrolase family 57 [bacterium]
MKIHHLQVYTIFHLNLAYSSIEEDHRPQVLHRCYWPLLYLARQYGIPFGIEATAYTLESILAIDPSWVAELRRLTTEGPCEFIGSGYAQIIGPLVPTEVNAANLRLGNQLYEKNLGFCPRIALINEQAYSTGLINHYLNSGYKAIVMEWDNPASFHPEWKREWRYLPQIACGQHGEEIPVIWNKSIAFQKFQRYAHGEIESDEYMDYLSQHISDTPRAFSMYGNDCEIFDYRPGRFHTEAVINGEGEWRRIEQLFNKLLHDERFQFIAPSHVLELINMPGAGNRLHLESPEQPVPVKKQGKYNITRWAVTGRDNLGINTRCWRIYDALRKDHVKSDDDWRELCYLWSSDFRTHITEKRWAGYQERLSRFEGQLCLTHERLPFNTSASTISDIDNKRKSISSPASINRTGRYLSVETGTVKVRLNLNKGLAFDGIWFKGISEQPLVGTLLHGYYDDITLGADFYTGHLIMESPGKPKVTDLNPVNPVVENRSKCVEISGDIATSLGPVQKLIRVWYDQPCVEFEYYLNWKVIPLGTLRVGHITINPAAFDRDSLFYRTFNGGFEWETFYLDGTKVDQGNPVSFLVSASHGIGITNGIVDLGDKKRFIRITVDKTLVALIGFITYRSVGDTYFYRLGFSAGETDETRQDLHSSAGNCSMYRMQISILPQSLVN